MALLKAPMVNVSIYIYKNPFEKVLPKLLEKALAHKARCFILTSTEEEAEALSTSLWTYTPLGFLPHGTPKDGFFDQQPIVLTSQLDLVQQVDILFLYSAVPPLDWIQKFKRCFHFIPRASSQDNLKETIALYSGLSTPPQIWQQEEVGNWIKGTP